MGATITTNQQEKVVLQGQTGLTTNFSLHDLRIAFYGGKVSQNDAIRAYLQSKLGITTPQSLTDLWRLFFIYKGAANRVSLTDMAKDFFTNIGLSSTYSDTNSLDTGNFAGSISTAGALNLSGAAVTIAAWCKFTQFQGVFPNIATIAGIEDNSDVNVALLRLGDAGLASNKVQFIVLTDASHVLNGNTGLSTGIWTHIAGVYDGSNMYIYINGVQDAVTPATGLVVANDIFRASLSNGGQGRQISGLIDEVRAYTRALTVTEISNLANKIEPSTNGLKLYWKFDEGSGASAIDSSGNNNSGTISSCTYSTDHP